MRDCVLNKALTPQFIIGVAIIRSSPQAHGINVLTPAEPLGEYIYIYICFDFGREFSQEFTTRIRLADEKYLLDRSNTERTHELVLASSGELRARSVSISLVHTPRTASI